MSYKTSGTGCFNTLQTSLGTITTGNFGFKPRRSIQSIVFPTSVVEKRPCIMPSPKGTPKSIPKTLKSRFITLSPSAKVIGPKLNRSVQLPSSPGSKPTTIPELETSTLFSHEPRLLRLGPRPSLKKKKDIIFTKMIDGETTSRFVGIKPPAESNCQLPEENMKLQDKFLKWKIELAKQPHKHNTMRVAPRNLQLRKAKYENSLGVLQES